MWAKLMKERFHAKKPTSLMLRFHSQTAGSTLTQQQPENNVVRVTLQALAAVFGGTQSLHTNSRDEALGLPSESAVRTALRTQQVIAFESGVADVADPLAGSYYVEFLTDEIEKRATELMHEIEGKGGTVACIESGWIQRQIQDAAFEAQQAIEDKSSIVVGVNEFTEGKEDAVEVLRVREAVAREQVDAVKNLRQSRDPRKAATALEKLERTAKDGGNVMPAIVEASASSCTLGEMSDTLRKVFGLYHENVVV
jgi:methylmalonyl-CoA mutase N-terminal domain/subunit